MEATEKKDSRPITQMLQKWTNGENGALEELMQLAMPTLQRIARIRFSSERINHTMTTGDLINELCLSLLKQENTWENRKQFFAACSIIMRNILIDHSRRYHSQKRAGHKRVDNEEGLLENIQTVGTTSDIENLGTAIDKLRHLNKRQALILEWSYFLGLTQEEIATALQMSERNVRRELANARVFLKMELKKGE